MQITKPTFYKEFSCIAGACPDTCCAGWQIMIDEKSLQKYRRFKGPFRNRLHNDIDWKEHSFCQYDKRCAFLNEDNLCDIYSEAGKDMLCDTCQKYPRHIEEFEGLREYSLSLSCPEAARIFLSHKEKITFFTREAPYRSDCVVRNFWHVRMISSSVWTKMSCSSGKISAVGIKNPDMARNF
jgi:lysine-N-methylase